MYNRYAGNAGYAGDTGDAGDTWSADIDGLIAVLSILFLFIFAAFDSQQIISLIMISYFILQEI